MEDNIIHLNILKIGWRVINIFCSHFTFLIRLKSIGNMERNTHHGENFSSFNTQRTWFSFTHWFNSFIGKLMNRAPPFASFWWSSKWKRWGPWTLWGKCKSPESGMCMADSRKSERCVAFWDGPWGRRGHWRCCRVLLLLCLKPSEWLCRKITSLEINRRGTGIKSLVPGFSWFLSVWE